MHAALGGRATAAAYAVTVVPLPVTVVCVLNLPYIAPAAGRSS
eukprot:COSAG01_NODE_66871_length_268_cov_2.124260_1_plen_42_part_10